MQFVDDRMWQRVCAAIDGFRSEFGRWPQRVRLSQAALEDIRDYTLAPEFFSKVCSTIDFVVTDEHVIAAEDDSGAQYDYGRKGFKDNPPEVPAYEWFGRTEYRESHEESGFEIATKPNYLGSPEVVSELVGRYFDAMINHVVKRVDYGELDKLNIEIGEILSGEVEEYPSIPGWNTADCLGKAIVKLFGMDTDYYKDECLLGIVTEGLAAVTSQVRELVSAFENDDNAEWDRDAIPQLTQLHQFVTTVMMGSHSFYFPGKHLKDFTWEPAASGKTTTGDRDA